MPKKTVKTTWISIRVTKDEKRMAKRKAKAAGFGRNVSGFINWLIFNFQPIKKHELPQMEDGQ